MKVYFSGQSIRESLRLLSFLPRRRISALRWLVVLSLIPGVLDFLSIAVVGRLTGALIGGRLNNLLPGVRVFGGTQLEQSLWLMAMFVCLVWMQSIIRILLRLIQERTASSIWLDLSQQIFESIVDQPYEYHLSNNSSRLSSDLLGSLESLLKQIITPVLRAFSSLVSILILIVGIIYIGGSAAFGFLVIMVSSYVVMSLLMTSRLRFASSQKLRSRDQYTHIFFETFKSIKDIKLTESSKYFLARFRDVTIDFKKADTQSLVLPEVPRMLIEALGITAIFALGVLPKLLSGNSEEILQALPFLATLSVGALRLSKPLQDLFTAISKLRGGLPEIKLINQLLALQDTVEICNTSESFQTSSGVFPRRSIALSNVFYSYPSSKGWVLKNINMVIPVGSRVAFVGSTGSGKSTATSILLSLLSPQKGSLLLDGVPVEKQDLRAWHSCCSEVPQNIQLLDGSIYTNIAFGQEEKDINFDLVWDALDAAQLQNLVADLPYGIYTRVGENGINLSGGQRQRIALARAFYSQSKFLILDEATSALDNQTEADVIQSLDIIGRRCTTVVVAHRLTTIQKCDRIFEFCNGEIVASGSFDELREKSPSFNKFVEFEFNKDA